jgi:LPS export ABC transporter protein LptC
MMRKRKWIQTVLLAGTVLTLVAVIFIFIAYRHVTNSPETLLDLAKNKADMQLNRIHQTAMKNGIQEWTLEAASATLIEEEKSVLLTKPEVEFFMSSGDNIQLTADSGVIKTDSSHLRVEGHVKARTNEYRFQTQTLDYDPEDRELRSDSPVTLSGNAFALKANRMALDLKTNVTRFEGDVKGIINEDFQL